MNTEHPRKLFLLGGYDLEMLTIKQMLEGREDCVVLDQHLHWGNALLSAYQSDLQRYEGYEVYGIELKEDIPLPVLYTRIDHHNDWNGKPSALEQVAAILEVSLNRFQQLVSANDKGYIPAMQALPATDEEIAEIRRKDREAQGVSKADELLAEQSVHNSLSRYGSLLVVESLTPCFSPICDRLFPYHRLLVFTDTEWMFYGEGKAELVVMLREEVRQEKVFHGGGDNGYVGAVDKTYGKDEIKQFVKHIINQYGI